MSEYPAPYESPRSESSAYALSPPPASRGPRIWTVFVVFIVAMVAHIVTATLVANFAAVIVLGWQGATELAKETRAYEAEKGVDVELDVESGIPVVEEDPEGEADSAVTTGEGEGTEEENDEKPPIERSPFEEWMISFAKTPIGFAVVIFPGQLAFLGVTLIFAFLSPEPLRERLALRRPSEPWIVWTIFALATPAAALIVTVPLSNFVDQDASRNLADMQEIFSSGGVFFFLLTVLGVALMPALAEEALFRGYIQSRLLKRWPAWAAIVLSGVLFSIAHLDPVQSLGVLPLGIWMGIVAFRTRSLFPAIACHLVNNSYALVAMRLASTFEGQDPAEIDLTRWEPWAAIVIVLSSMFFFAVSGLYLLATGLLGQLFAPPPAPPEQEEPVQFVASQPPDHDPAGVEFLSDVRPYQRAASEDDDAPYAIPVDDPPKDDEGGGSPSRGSDDR